MEICLVCPIPKSNNSRDINDFRPIAILPAFAKVFEPVISTKQHGFVSKK